MKTFLNFQIKFLSLLFYILTFYNTKSVLFPYESEYRTTKSLNGLWNFILTPYNNNNLKIKDIKEYLQDESNIIKMPVPSSFNDVTTNTTYQNQMGVVLYWKDFYIPQSWIANNTRVFIYFGSIHYSGKVWINEKLIGVHNGGHIGFSFEITKAINVGVNNIIVAVNNILDKNTIPQMFVKEKKSNWYTEGYTTYNQRFDYFNYAGILRPVTLYTTPSVYISDINIIPDYDPDTQEGSINFGIILSESVNDTIIVDLYSKDEEIFFTKKFNTNGTHLRYGFKLDKTKTNPWWPTMSNHKPGYLYKFQVTLETDSCSDIYRIPLGIRKVDWNQNTLLVNGEPVYLMGFGMHEDSEIRGRGFDNVVMTRDFNLINWVGGNSFRTSHYPYADEMLDEADARGFLLILETPACRLCDLGNKKLLEEHKRVLKEIVSNHKNRPSIIMWSLANEPESQEKSAAKYFSELVSLCHTLDNSRPATFVTFKNYTQDKAYHDMVIVNAWNYSLKKYKTDNPGAVLCTQRDVIKAAHSKVKYMDIICLNRYNGWYKNAARTYLIQLALVNEVKNWKKTYPDKPMMITEYGAETYVGQHDLPANMWSEEYQVEVLFENFKAFDELRCNDLICGELVWNLIDFKVPQEIDRVGLNRKGIFTRNRQPKKAAYILRRWYHKLSNNIIEHSNNCSTHA